MPAALRPLLVCASSSLLLFACAQGPVQETDGPEPVGEAVAADTVAEAVANSCSTTSVKGLSDQIIAQSTCIAPGAFVALPPIANLSLGAAVFPYLEQPANDAFVAALAANPGMTMQVNSMLRTVAQQYLLYAWYQNGQCGIGLAATPGGSNHETGLALDVSDYSAWKSALQAVGFAWFGNADPVHFDYVGPGAVDYKGTDVLAFQQLWNLNHPEDPIAEDGAYGPQTGARLALSPADGFPIGATCNPTSVAPDVYPALTIDADDRYADGSSLGLADLVEGDVFTATVTLKNQGALAASNVAIGIALDAPYFVATDYLIETDWMHPGTFVENDANVDPANPAHGAALEAPLLLGVNALSPGETKRVTVIIEAARTSISPDPAPSVKLWVRDIPGFYQAETFGGDVDNVGDGQTFGGGRLEARAQGDVYSPTRWEWNSDRLEGWSTLGGATIAADPYGAGLTFTGDGDDPAMALTDARFSAADHPTIELSIQRDGGAGDATLYFATDEDPELDEAKSIRFTVPDDGQFHTVALDASAHSAWTGTITALRLDPFVEGSGAAMLDYVRATDGEPGKEGLPSAGSGVGIDGDGSPDPVGCACRASGSEGGSPRPLAALFAFALTVSAGLRRFRRTKRLSC